jgi:hypothetical protein
MIEPHDWLKLSINTTIITFCDRINNLETLGARVPGFQWEHAEYIAGIEALCVEGHGGEKTKVY